MSMRVRVSGNGRRRALARVLRHLREHRNGTAAVELALVAPMLLILSAGIIDFARVYHEEIELSSGVAAAANMR